MRMDKQSRKEIFFLLFGFSLMWVSMAFREVQFLAWIGIWIVLIMLFWNSCRIRKEARKQGKDIIT